MGVQTLDGYVFPWDPDRWTIPMAEKFWGKVQTYESAAFFSFGVSIIGKQILLEWDWMSEEQFEQLNSIFVQDEPVIWNPPTPGSYTVNILSLDGEYFEVLGTDFHYRRNVKLGLMIMEELPGS